MTRKTKIILVLAFAAGVAFQLWRTAHKKPPPTAAQIKEFEDSENMFPAESEPPRHVFQ